MAASNWLIRRWGLLICSLIWINFSSGIITSQLHAQNKQLIDSLNHGLEKAVEDSSRIEYLNELSWQWRKFDNQQAMRYAQQALQLSLDNDYHRQIATSLNRIGEVYRLEGKYRTAIEPFKMALTMDQKHGYTHGMARASSQLGTLYGNLGQYDSSLYYSLASLRLFKQTENTAALGRSHTRIAAIYKDMTQYGLAIAHYDSALDIQLERFNEIDMAHTFLSLGNLYKDMSLLDSAKNHYEKSLAIWDHKNEEYEKAKVLNAMGIVYLLQNSYDSALYYFDHSLELKKKVNARGIMDITYNNIGNVHANTGRLDSALVYYLKSLEIKQENKDSVGLAMTYANIGIIYKTSNDYDKALEYLNKSLQYSEAQQDLTILIEIYSNLSEIYTQLGDLDKALNFKNKYLLIRDSLDVSVRSAAIMRGRYETERNRRIISEKEEQIQAAELESIRAENEFKKLIIWTITLGLLLLILGLIFYYRYKLQRQQVLIAEKDKNIFQQRVHKLLKEQEINAINAMIEGQEGERKRIAKDLHDRLGSLLSVVKIHFKSVEDHIMEEMKSRDKVQYQKANELLDEACGEVRKIAHDMVSGVLSKFGLIPALKSLKQSVEETGQLKMNVLDFGFGEERLDYDTEINLYRIIQELLSNVLRHAEAKQLSVQLIKKNNKLNLVVEDDGVGFKTNGRPEGIGLQNVFSRVDKLHGEMQIDSGKGAGTTITIDFSLNNNYGHD